jgi:protein-disulfide isomerase
VLEQFPDKVKLVYMNYPLSNHKYAVEAAMAALAADRQGKFWEFSDALYKYYKKLNDEKVQKIASKLQLDMEKFTQDRKDPAFKFLIEKDIQNGQAAKVKGIPTIFVNGKRVKSKSLKGITQMVQIELNKLGKKQKKAGPEK